MINFTDVPTSTLVTVYNACAVLLGSNPVKKFADRATAEKRTKFALSQLAPEKRPAPFTEALPGGATALDTMKGSVRAKDAPHPAIKSVTSVSGPALAEASKEAIVTTKDATPTPAVTPTGERWRRPKRVAPGKVAYRPRPGSLQQAMYDLLTQEGGVTVEAFCAEMERLGAKPTMTKLAQTWSNLGYLFVTLKGYGLEFDGQVIKLLVPADERAAVAQKGG